MPWPFSSRKRNGNGIAFDLRIGAIEAVARTDRGRRYPENQDAVGLAGDASRELMVLVVADGVGGLADGSGASQATVSAVAAAVSELPSQAPIEALRDALIGVNERLCSAASASGGASSGSTVVAMLIEGRLATVLHAGDSRAYLLRGGELILLTRDHSLVMDQVEQGLLTEEQAANSPRRNVITRCVGVDPDLELEVTEVGQLEAGDRILLCSDGLHGVVPRDELIEAVSSNDSLRDVAARLITLANNLGGPDNISAVLARV